MGLRSVCGVLYFLDFNFKRDHTFYSSLPCDVLRKILRITGSYTQEPCDISEERLCIGIWTTRHEWYVQVRGIGHNVWSLLS